MEENEDGVLQNEDPERLHDYRIAVRRTRSALGQIKGSFRKGRCNVLPPFFLAWTVYQRTSRSGCLPDGLQRSEVRTADTYRESLEPLRGFLENRADLAHAEMARQMHSQRYRRLLADWRKFLSTPCPKRPQALLPCIRSNKLPTGVSGSYSDVRSGKASHPWPYACGKYP